MSNIRQSTEALSTARMSGPRLNFIISLYHKDQFVSRDHDLMTVSGVFVPFGGTREFFCVTPCAHFWQRCHVASCILLFNSLIRRFTPSSLSPQSLHKGNMFCFSTWMFHCICSKPSPVPLPLQGSQSQPAPRLTRISNSLCIPDPPSTPHCLPSVHSLLRFSPFLSLKLFTVLTINHSLVDTFEE